MFPLRVFLTVIGVYVVSGTFAQSTSKIHSVKDLALSLTQNVAQDSQKVVAIWNWMTHNIKQDVKGIKRYQTRHIEAQAVFEHKKTNALGYSKLFTALCKEANLPVYTVRGYTKVDDYELYNQFFRERYAWNALEINKKWYVLDVCAAAGKIKDREKKWVKRLGKLLRKPTWQYQFKYEYDSTFFLINPKKFAVTHNPADPMWQLLNCTMPLSSVFEQKPGYAMYFVKMYDSCFKHQDVVRTEVIRYTPDEQELRSAFTAKAYNPRNHGYVGYTCLEYGDKYFNGVPYSSSKGELLGKARFLYDSAVVFLKETAKDIEKEFKFLNKQNLHKKKTTVDTNNKWIVLHKKTIQNNKRLIQNHKSKVQNLKKQNSKMLAQTKGILKNGDQLASVPYAKTPPTKDKLAIIQQNNLKVEQNHVLFNQYKDSAYTKIAQYQTVYTTLSKNLFDTQLPYLLYARYIGKNIQERKTQKADAYWEMFQLRRSDMIERYKRQVLLRTEFIQIYAPAHQKIKADLQQYKQTMVKLIGENKTLIKQNKKLASDIGSEDQEYLSEKKQQGVIDEFFSVWSKAEISFLKKCNGDYREQNLTMKALNKLMTTENILEKARYKTRQRQYHLLRKVESAKQKKAYQHAVAQKKACKKTIDAYSK